MRYVVICYFDFFLFSCLYYKLFNVKILTVYFVNVFLMSAVVL